MGGRAIELPGLRASEARIETSYLPHAEADEASGTISQAGQGDVVKTLGQAPQGAQARGSDGQP